MRTLDTLTHGELAMLAREHLLAGHLIDRGGMPQVIAELGADAMKDVAIEEWMGASPVYTRRIRRLLGFDDEHDVSAIFKGMQFDIGAPHRFMDFRYKVIDAENGEFWLDHCGALMDVEPMGEEFVVAMCHDIEDPTFDATACATNPRARMRPVHRPPRSPADRHPHCHWTVTIDPTAVPVDEPAPAKVISTTRAGAIPLPEHDLDRDDPTTSYRGEVDPDLRLERFDANTLHALLDELALQGQMLAISFLLAVGSVADEQQTRRIGVRQLTGVAGLVAGRLQRAFALGSSLDDVATVLALHPALQPRSYLDLRIELDGSPLRLALHDSPGLHEDVAPSWPQLLTADPAPLAAIAQAVDPHAAVSVADPATDEVAAWTVDHDPARPPAPEPDEVLLAKFSTGADFPLH